MNWFRGSIPEAIAAAKRVNGIFAVFVYDKSESSVSTREKLNDEEISKVLGSLQFVAIEIENGTNDAIQFAQIYPLIVVPSLFFISPQNGIPMEVVGGTFDTSTLLEKLNKMVATNSERHRNDPTVKEEVNAAENSRLTTSETENLLPSTSETRSQTSAPVVTSRTDAAEEESASPVISASTTEAASMSSSGPQSEDPQPSLDERVQRAKEMLAQKQGTKTLEEIEEEKQKEVERRRQSQEMLKAKQKREEMERLDLNKQRKKEKEEDRLARERVKAQIAADRAERLARNALFRGEAPVPSQEPPAAPPSAPPSAAVPQNQNRSSVVRIKFRFPDNTSQSAQFPPESTLGDVKTYLLQNCSLLSKNIKLVATLPPRSFSDEHMPQTLVELGLTPSAIIIVKPVTISPSVNIVPSGDGVMAFFWALIAPITFILNYLRGMFGLGGESQESSVDSSDEEGSQEPKRPRTEGSYTTRNRPKTAYGRRVEGEAFLRREGNIHRLNQRGEGDDDDENNTWNGNSTQQM